MSQNHIIKYSLEELREIAKLPLSRVKPPNLPECCVVESPNKSSEDTAHSDRPHHGHKNPNHTRGGPDHSKWDLIFGNPGTSLGDHKRERRGIGSDHQGNNTNEFGKSHSMMSTGDPLRDMELAGCGEVKSRLPSCLTRTVPHNTPPREKVNANTPITPTDFINASEDITDVDALFGTDAFVDPTAALVEAEPVSSGSSRMSRWVDLTHDSPEHKSNSYTATPERHPSRNISFEPQQSPLQSNFVMHPQQHNLPLNVSAPHPHPASMMARGSSGDNNMMNQSMQNILIDPAVSAITNEAPPPGSYQPSAAMLQDLAPSVNALFQRQQEGMVFSEAPVANVGGPNESRFSKWIQLTDNEEIAPIQSQTQIQPISQLHQHQQQPSIMNTMSYTPAHQQGGNSMATPQQSLLRPHPGSQQHHHHHHHTHTQNKSTKVDNVSQLAQFIGGTTGHPQGHLGGHHLHSGATTGGGGQADFTPIFASALEQQALVGTQPIQSPSINGAIITPITAGNTLPQNHALPKTGQPFNVMSLSHLVGLPSNAAAQVLSVEDLERSLQQ